MNTKSCWGFLQVRDSRARLWIIVLLSILIVGVTIRFVEVTNDTFGFDEYACMMEVDQSFPTYVKGHGCFLQILVHYWLSYRVFGGSLIAYRTMSLIAGISVLLLTALCLRRFWPSEKGICLIVLLVLIPNSNALYLTRYSMFSYGNSLLVSTGLFFLFMRLAEGPIEKRKWLWISVGFLPAAFFSNFTTMVPLATGTLLVIVFRWWRFDDSRNLAGLWRWLWELKPLLIFPLTYLIIHILFPFTHLGAEKRPDMAPLFFTTSNLSQDVIGVMKFTLTRTFSLFLGMLVTIFKNGFEKAIMILYFLLAGLAVLQAVRGKVDQRIKFTIFFLLITIIAILGASVMGFYPYGKIRYTPYLILPTIILIGFGGSLVYRWIFERWGLTRSMKALLTFSAVVILITGGYVSAERYSSFASTRKSNYQAINWLITQKPDLILSDSYMMVVLSARAPEVYERVHSMGWRTFWGENVVPPELVDMITGLKQPQPVASILVILRRKEIARDFPRWNTLLNTYFNLDTRLEAPNICVGLYRRKA